MHLSHSSATVNLPTCATLPAEPPKILLADDHDLVRCGLRTLIECASDRPIEWREVGNLADAIAAFAAEPDIALVLLDLNMGDCKGLQGLRQFRQTHPTATVAVVSGTHDDFVVGQALALGAVGFVPKTQSAERSCAAVLELLAPPAGGFAVSAARSSGTRVPHHAAGSTYDRIAELGPRHLEILELVLSGCSNQEIASTASLSLGTVKNYVSTILLALDVKSRSHLISLFH
jgi:DNA-binding NarL/FixJ family response regulator